jgi:hypothetical protein
MLERDGAGHGCRQARIADDSHSDLQGTALGGVVTVKLVDNGGNGGDIFSSIPTLRAPTDCSPLIGGLTDTLTNGRAVVFDAPLAPTSRDQCKDGGWRNYQQFKNQGDCVSYVETAK